MRIVIRALGIAMGGCLIALFLYVMLALPGALGSGQHRGADDDAKGTSTTVRPP